MQEAVESVWLLQFLPIPSSHGQGMKKRKNPLITDDLLNKRPRPQEFATINATFTDTLGSMYSWAPTIQTFAKTFQGQTAEVYTCEFGPSGQHVASAGVERSIYLWDTFSDGSNYGIIRAHLGAILELHWSKDGSKVFTASADKTCGVFDAQTGEQLKSCKGHMSVVSSCSLSRQGAELLVSGSNDGTVKVSPISPILASVDEP